MQQVALEERDDLQVLRPAEGLNSSKPSRKTGGERRERILFGRGSPEQVGRKHVGAAARGEEADSVAVERVVCFGQASAVERAEESA